ncbi:MAG: hypothetical protein QXI33_02055 [Candidatus Pacearchaeota archaeon]
MENKEGINYFIGHCHIGDVDVLLFDYYPNRNINPVNFQRPYAKLRHGEQISCQITGSGECIFYTKLLSERN